MPANFDGFRRRLALQYDCCECHHSHQHVHCTPIYSHCKLCFCLWCSNADKSKKNLDDKTPLGVAEINEKQELYDILK